MTNQDDISHQTETALRQSEEKFRTLVNTAPFGIQLTDLEGRILYSNPAHHKMQGYGPHELIGMNIWDLMANDSHRVKAREYYQTIISKKPEPTVYFSRDRTRDGREIDVQINWDYIHNEKDEITGIISIVEEITDRKKAEEALLESEQFLKILLESLPIPVFYKDLEGRYKGFNKAFEIFFGRSRLELIGRSVFDINPPELAMIYHANDSELYKKISRQIYESQVKNALGELRNVVFHKATLTNASGAISGLVGAIMDITEAKQAAEAVIKSNNILQTIINTAPVRIFYKNRELRYMGCNKAFAKDAGIASPEDVVGKDDYQLVWKEQAELYRTDDRRVLESGIPKLSYDEPQTTPEGKLIWLQTSKVPLLNDSNEIIGVLGMYEDISERKRAEEALREQRDFSESLIETAQAIILVLETKGRIVSFNPFMEKLVGYDLHEVKGMDWFETFLTPEIDRSIKPLFQKTVADINTSGNVNPIIAKDGRTILVEWYNKTLKDKDGCTVGILAIGQDITERKRLEVEQKQLQTQLQQAQKMEAIGTLAGGIAHDFNNILGAILGYAEMAQEDSPAGSILRKDIEQVITASHRAKDLVKQILAFSRQTETEHISVQPALIIKETLKMLRSSLPSTIAIQQDIDMEAGPLLADPTQIHQVMTNLCTNAFHAMEETGGTLSISLKSRNLSRDDLASEPQLQPGRFVQLSIGDTGPGIAPEIREKIFEPYFTTKEVGKGTGMGLAIVHGIAKSYKGFVSCHSVLSEGTVFHVYLPVIAEPALSEPLSAPLDPTQFGNERILFVDDEEILAEMGKVMLERLGYRVIVRRNSLEALNTFQNQSDQFDLVITDQTMPGMTGIDMARRMLQIRPGMPIILCTGYSSLISEDKAKSFGIMGFAMKPLAKNDLAVLIRKVLNGENMLS